MSAQMSAQKRRGTEAEQVPNPSRSIHPLSSITPSEWINANERLFHDTGNPVYLLESFWWAYAGSVSPPLWVVSSLAKAFQEFLDARGRKTLDEVLGFKRGRRKDSWFLSREGEYIGAAMTMFWLICLFEVTVKQAARMVAARRKTRIADGTVSFPESKISLSARTLEQHYSRHWKKKYKLDPHDIEGLYHPERFKEWTDEKKRQFVNSFPQHSLPRAIRDYFSQAINCRSKSAR